MGRSAEIWRLRSQRSALASIGCLSLYLARYLYSSGERHTLGFNDILLVAASIIFTVIALLSRDISKLNPADDYTLGTTLIQYLMVRVPIIIGKFATNYLLKNTNGIEKQQNRFLMNLLYRHKDTTYGKDYNFPNIKSATEFRQKHPLTNYRHYTDYIKQLMEGNKKVLTVSPCIGFATSSGTTGKTKAIPWSKDMMSMMVTQILFPLCNYAIVNKGASLNLNKVFHFRYQPKVDTTSSGLDIAPFTYILLKRLSYLPIYTAPKTVLSIENEHAAFYVHGLFALRDRCVGSLIFNFIGQLYAFWQFIIVNIDSICDDISNGTIKRGFDIQEDVYTDIKNCLYPDEQRANEIRRQFDSGLEGLAKRLWPNLSYSRCITLKTMEPQTEYLKNTILKDVVFLTIYYAASEGVYGLDLSKEELSDKFLLAYTSGYFEFIRECDTGDEQPKTYLAHELDLKHRYELVVTNGLGLCRYRSGDVVQVDSFQNECPVITVEYRIGQLLNMRGEKTPESVFFEAVSEACDKIGVTLIDYTTSDSAHLQRGDYESRYILFIETEGNHIIENSAQFDKCLCDKSKIYKDLREGNKFAPLEVIQVLEGTFLKMRQLMTENNTASQFKMPRVLTQKFHIDFIMNSKM